MTTHDAPSGAAPREAGRPLLRTVLLVDHAAELGGAQLALLESLGRLDPAWRVSAVGPSGAYAERLGAAGVDVQHREGTARNRRAPRREQSFARQLVAAGSLLGLAVHAGRVMRQQRPTLIYVNSLRSVVCGLLPARLAGRATVLVHLRDLVDSHYLPDPVVRGVVRVMLRWLPHVVVANSRTTARSAPRGTAEVIHSPISADFFDRHRRTGAGGDVFGIVGRLDPWKGQDLFLRAFARADLGPDARAVVVGGPLFGREEYEESLHLLVADLGIADRVRFTGQVEDVVSAIDGLDVLVHATRGVEPFGQTVVQGLSRGRVVIAMAAGGPTEVITHEVDGLLVPPEDVDELAAAMSRIGRDRQLRDSLAAAGVLRAQDFRAEVLSATWNALLDRCSRPDRRQGT